MTVNRDEEFNWGSAGLKACLGVGALALAAYGTTGMIYGSRAVSPDIRATAGYIYASINGDLTNTARITFGYCAQQGVPPQLIVAKPHEFEICASTILGSTYAMILQKQDNPAQKAEVNDLKVDMMIAARQIADVIGDYQAYRIERASTRHGLQVYTLLHNHQRIMSNGLRPAL